MTNPDAPSYLTIRFHLADGSLQTFFQENETAAQRILQSLRPAQLFKQGRIMLAGTYSMTAFVPAHLTKVDFVCQDFGGWEFPSGLSDIVELGEPAFRESSGLDDPVRQEKRNHQHQPGDPTVTFIDLEMASGRHYYLMIGGVSDLPAERFSRLQLLLSGSNLHARIPEGGVTLFNLGKLVRFTIYPGPREAPIDAWPAHHQAHAGTPPPPKPEA